MGVAFGKSGKLGRIEPRIHAGQNGEVAGRWHSELRFLAERLGVGLVCVKDLFQNL
jgi:hypothetical protein